MPNNPTIATPTHRVPAVVAAAFCLIARGHTVEQQDIPGLWRVVTLRWAVLKVNIDEEVSL